LYYFVNNFYDNLPLQLQHHLLHSNLHCPYGCYGHLLRPGGRYYKAFFSLLLTSQTKKRHFRLNSLIRPRPNVIIFYSRNLLKPGICYIVFVPAKCLRVRLEPTQVKYLTSAPFLGVFLALSTNIRIGWKALPGTNTPVYYEQS
jgi:hypothetical protein